MASIYYTYTNLTNNLVVPWLTALKFFKQTSTTKTFYNLWDSSKLTPLVNPTIQSLTSQNCEIVFPQSLFKSYMIILVEVNNQQRWYEVEDYEILNDNVKVTFKVNNVWTLLMPLLKINQDGVLDTGFYCERAHKSPWIINDENLPDVNLKQSTFLMSQKTPNPSIYHQMPLQLINPQFFEGTHFIYKVDMLESVASSAQGLPPITNTLAYTPILGTDGETYWTMANLIENTIDTTKGFLISPVSLMTTTQVSEQAVTGNSNVPSTVLTNLPGLTWNNGLTLQFNTPNTTQQAPFINPSTFWQSFNYQDFPVDYWLLSQMINNPNFLHTLLEPSLFLKNEFLITYANASYTLTPYYDSFNNSIYFFNPNYTNLSWCLNNQFPNLEIIAIAGTLQNWWQGTYFNSTIPICSIPINNELSGVINSWSNYYNQNRLVASTMSKLKHMKDASVDLTQSSQIANMLNPLHLISSLFNHGVVGTGLDFGNEMLKDSIARTSINLDYSNSFGLDAKYRMERQAVMTGGGNNLSGNGQNLTFYMKQPSLFDTARYLSNIYTYGYELGYNMSIKNIWDLGWMNFTFIKGELLSSFDFMLPIDFEHLQQIFKSGFWLSNVWQFNNVPSFNFLKYLENPTTEQLGQYLSNFMVKS